MSDEGDEIQRLRELLRWALQVIDDDLGWEVSQRKSPMYREAKDAVATLPEEES